MIYRFDQFELREKDFCLYENGKRIALEPKALRVLLLLLSKAGHLVEKNFLLETVWNNTFVEENTLTRTILVLRRALGDNRRDRVLIETVPTKGYRFVAEVRQLPEQEDRSQALTAASENERVTENSHPGEEQPIRPGFWRRYLPVVAALLVLVAVAGGWLRSRVHATAHTATQPSIAVLPIINLTGDPGNDYISDGVTESSIQEFSGIGGVRVIGSGSVARYKGAQQDVRSIGRTLGVDTVLQGRLRRVDGRLTFAVELCRVSDGSVLFSREYLPEDKDLRPVQADMVRDTLQALRVEAGARQAKPELLTYTSNPIAYEEFLRGKALARGNSPAELHEAVQHFEKATAIDPAFDLAWSDLAEAHLMLGLYFEAPREHMEIARRAAQRALELNHGLEQAHGSLGVIDLVYDWNFAAAVSELEPEESSRSAVTSLACTVHLLDQTGRSRNAEEMVRRMLAYDPQSARLVSELGCVAYYHRHYDEAVRSYTAAIENDPGSPLPYWGLGKSLTQLGQYQQAVEAFDRFSERNGVAPPILTAEAGYTLAKWGKKKEARERMDQLETESHSGFVDPYLIALVHLGLDDREETFAWLAKAEQVRSTFLISTLTDPKWEKLIPDPRFGAMVARMSPKEKENASLVGITPNNGQPGPNR